jgi:hypothetical protein
MLGVVSLLLKKGNEAGVAGRGGGSWVFCGVSGGGTHGCRAISGLQRRLPVNSQLNERRREKPKKTKSNCLLKIEKQYCCVEGEE